MTKPKFTPDPAPNIEGVPVEQALRMFMDHVQRQDNRIEDWWPKDLEDRVEALELLVPYMTGTWPIVDYSSVTFGYEVEKDIGECSRAEEFPSGSLVKIENCSNLDYSAPNNLVIASGQPFNYTGTGLAAFDATTGSVKFAITDCNRKGHKIVSTPGSSDRDLLAYIHWPCGGSTRTLLFYDISGTLTYLGGVSLGSANAEIIAERDADILLSDSRTPTQAFLVNKSTHGLTVLTVPTGWTMLRAAAISSTQYLICLWDGTDLAFSVYTTGSSISTPSVTLGNVGGTLHGLVPSNPQIVGSEIWWCINTGVSPVAQWLVKTDFAGNLIQSVSKFDSQSIFETRTGADQLFYDSTNNSLYYMYNATIWRYDISAATYHTCTPLFESITPGVGRSSSLIRVNGYHWSVFLDSSTWSIEKIEASF